MKYRFCTNRISALMHSATSNSPPKMLKLNLDCYCICGHLLVEAVANPEHLRSIGIRSSYSVGACSIMPAVPASTASVKIHRNNRSSTIATYFQSSFTFVESSCSFVCSAMKRTQKQLRCTAGGQQ